MTRRPELKSLLDEGVPIVLVLSVWAVLIAISEWVVRDLGSAGSLFDAAGRALSIMFAVAAVGTVLIYVISRGVALGLDAADRPVTSDTGTESAD